jgi:hypothetical protein
MPKFFIRKAKKEDWKITVLNIGFISSLPTCLADSRIFERFFLYAAVSYKFDTGT